MFSAEVPLPECPTKCSAACLLLHEQVTGRPGEPKALTLVRLMRRLGARIITEYYGHHAPSKEH